MIASMGYFYVSNRFTLSAFLGESLETDAACSGWRKFIEDAVLLEPCRHRQGSGRS